MAVVPHREHQRALEAFTAYCSLGKGRSLEALHLQLAQSWPNPPSLNTLKNWSRWHDWQWRVRGYDFEVTQAALKVRKEREVEYRHTRWEARLEDARLLREFCRRLLQEGSDDQGTVLLGAVRTAAAGLGAAAAIERADLMEREDIEEMQNTYEFFAAEVRAAIEEVAPDVAQKVNLHLMDRMRQRSSVLKK